MPFARRTLETFLAISLLHVAVIFAQTASSVSHLKEAFRHPPDDCRIMVRWWWFGPAITKAEIKRELEQMKAAGIGGVEIATLYPLALDDQQTGFRNLQFLSDEHIGALRFAADEARQLGLRVDITLGSGWPFGGPHIPVTMAAGGLRVEEIAIPFGATSIAIPAIGNGEKLIAAFLVSSPDDLTDGKQLEIGSYQNGRLAIPGELTNFPFAVFFISSRTGMTVKRPAIGAEGFVLDHYDRAALETHLSAVGDRLMQAFGDHPPYAIFSDSLEDYGSDWTPELLRDFRTRRGYDLAPHLLDLVGDPTARTEAIRHDWGRTLTELANDNYLIPLHAWAQQHHTLLRSQTYGYPPVSLSSNRFADLPEGEGKATLLMWRQFSDTRWAASAGHIFGKPVISSETWTWLHSPAFRATPLDMKAEADLHFLQGVNQLVGHGWPYSPEIAGEPGWRMYAAGAFNAHNPWWFAMPDLAGYLQRVSFALRQGKPANDVALLLPNDDVWSRFKVTANSPSAVITKTGFNTRASNISLDESMQAALGEIVIPEILDAGFNFDFVDADAIDLLGISHPVLILPGIERLPLSTYKKIEQYALHGGMVIATRRLPSTAPGFLNADAESQQIQQISLRLFRGQKAAGHFIEDETKLGSTLAAYAKPDVTFTPRTPELGFIHRRLNSGNLYFVANTSNHLLRAHAHFRNENKNAELWDAFTGDNHTLQEPAAFELSLEPYESRLIFFADSPDSTLHASAPWRGEARTIDLSIDWSLSFAGLNQAIHMDTLHSWIDDERFKYFSGQVEYRKSFSLPGDIKPGSVVLLDFGEGTTVPIPDPLPTFNMRAYLESPVREAAEVFVNGGRAGLVWHPPYILDLSQLLKPGMNQLRIVVGNTAINTLAGRALPDYRLLNDRYGERFVPQDMDNLRPLPSGILSGVRLRISSPE